MSKEAFIHAHEELIAEYQELHPEADWTESYEKTASKWTDPEASPELGSGVFLACLIGACIGAVVLVAFGVWMRSFL